MRKIEIEKARSIKFNKFIPAAIFREEDGCFIAITFFMPLYGMGRTEKKAIKSLKDEIYFLYQDLMEDDNFSSDWLKIKNKLKKIALNETAKTEQKGHVLKGARNER